MTTWTFHHFNGFLNYTSVFTSRVYCITILTSLPSTQLFPHSKIKDRLKELVQLCFIKMNCQRRYKYIVLAKNIFYCVNKNNTDTTKTFFEAHRSVQTIIEFYVRYIDDILSLNISKLFDFVDCIYPTELEAKDTLCLFMH
jgi:hypothetical protein